MPPSDCIPYRETPIPATERGIAVSPCRKKEKYLDIYTKVIPASRGSGVLDNLDIETTPLACPSQGYLKACQGASITTARPYKVFSSYYLVSQRISRYLPCHGRLGFPTLCQRASYRDTLWRVAVASRRAQVEHKGLSPISGQMHPICTCNKIYSRERQIPAPLPRCVIVRDMWWM